MLILNFSASWLERLIKNDLSNMNQNVDELDNAQKAATQEQAQQPAQNGNQIAERALGTLSHHRLFHAIVNDLDSSYAFPGGFKVNRCFVSSKQTRPNQLV